MSQLLSLQPKTKMTIVIVIGLVIIVAMLTGNFDSICELIRSFTGGS